MPYWPDPQSFKEVGSYVVTSNSEKEAADYKIRELEIAPVDKVTPTSDLTHPLLFDFFTLLINKAIFSSLSQPKQSRIIWHYQYMSWPDHGVPQEPGGVLSSLDQVNSKQAEFPGAGPMIIHCRYQTAGGPKASSPE